MNRLFYNAAYLVKLHWNELGSPEVKALIAEAPTFVSIRACHN